MDNVNLEVVYGHDRDAYAGNQSSPAPARSLEDQYPAAATAAVALAQLHSHRPDSEWESEAVSAISEEEWFEIHFRLLTYLAIGLCLGE